MRRTAVEVKLEIFWGSANRIEPFSAMLATQAWATEPDDTQKRLLGRMVSGRS